MEEVTSDHVSLTWDPPHSNLHNGIIREYLVEVTRTSKEMDPGNSGESGDKAGSGSGMGNGNETGSGIGMGSGMRSGGGTGGEGSYKETGRDEAGSAGGIGGRIARDSGDEGSEEGSDDEGSDDDGSGEEGTDEAMVMTYRTSTTSILISGLHPDAAYSIRVTGHTVEVGPYSDPILVYTLEDGKCTYMQC